MEGLSQLGKDMEDLLKKGGQSFLIKEQEREEHGWARERP